MPKYGSFSMKFADLHIQPDLDDTKQTRMMLYKSAELGYNSVGITFSFNVTQKEILKLKKMCEEIGLDLVTRIDLTPRTPRELLRTLNNIRKKFEIISVCCYQKDVARQSAKDKRVDLISFPSTDPRKRFFDLAEAELASKASASFEVDMAPLLFLHGFRRVRLLSALRKEVFIAKKKGVPIVLSSGTNDIHFLRKPVDYAFLSFIFGLNLDLAKKCISKNPMNIIKRNRRKLSSNYVAPGVQII
jgi:RNase P/RNase MRP subunit p30